jgi:hypothetical protein
MTSRHEIERIEPMNAMTSVRSRRWSAPVVVAITAMTIVSIGAIGAPAHAVDEPIDPATPTPVTTATTEPTPTTAPSPTTTAPSPTTAPPSTATTAPTSPTTAPPSTAPPTTPPAAAAGEPSEITPLPTAPATTVPAPAPRNVQALPSQIANILATIRYVESRGNYNAPPNRGRASGAYQFIASTWNGHGGYSHAYLAPPEIQDERAAIDVTRFLAQWNNDVSMIPVMWYYPRASRDVALMDIVPVPSAGNILTVREYQQRWLGVWAFLSGQPIPQQLTLGQALGRLGIPPTMPEMQSIDPAAPAIERKATIAFPVIGPTRLAAPDCGDAQDVAQNAGADAGATPEEIDAAGLCAQEAPGIVFGVKLQPVISVTGGVVTDVHDEPGDAISVTVTDDSGRSYTLAGFNNDNPGTNDGAAPPHLRLSALAKVGTGVRAGQILGFMGDSSPLPLGVRSDVPTDATVEIAADSVAPHIRLTIEDLDGTPVDAYGPVIDSLFRQVCSVGIGPWSGVPTGELHDAVTIETTDDNRDIDSEWVITSTGQVTATGWAAMIYPSESCGWAPELPYGPGAGGSTQVPSSWTEPLDLATPIWIELAQQADSDRPLAPLLRP